MYSKPEFSSLSREEVFDLIENNMFATVVTYGQSGLEASHLPFLLDRTRGPNGTLISHVARANAHSEIIANGCETLVVFQGVHGYISSSWYPATPRDSAPTWNFAVVHCRGRPVPLGDGDTRHHLFSLVEQMEKRRSDRWRMQELGAGGMERRMPHILGFELPIERIEAKFKMGQDERLCDTSAAIQALMDNDPALAETMIRHNAHRSVPKKGE